MPNFYYVISAAKKVNVGTDEVDIAPLYAPIGSASAETIGQVLYPRSQAEIDAGIADYQAGNPQGDIVNPEFPWGDIRRYGAADGIDSTEAIRYATMQAREQGSITAGQGGKVSAPSGQTFLITGDVDFRCCELDFKGTIDNGSSGATIFIGGYAYTRPNPTQYIHRVSSDVTDENVPDIEVWGAKGQKIHVGTVPVIYFRAWSGETGTNTYGNYTNNDIDYPYYRAEHGRVVEWKDWFRFNYSLAYSQLTVMKATWVKWKSGDRYEKPDGTDKPFTIGVAYSGTSGWINENDFFFYDIKEFQSVWETGKGTYGHNNNRIFGGWSDVAGHSIDFQVGNDNRWTGIRAEGVTDNGIKFGVRAQRNTLYVLYSSSAVNHPQFNFLVDDKGNANQVCDSESPAYELYPILQLDAETLQMDDEAAPTIYNLDGVGTRVSSDLNDKTTYQAGTITRSGGILTVSTNASIYNSPLIPVSPNAKSHIFVMPHQVQDESTQGLRVRIDLFDGDRNFLLPSNYWDTANISELEWVASTGGGTNEYYLQLNSGVDRDPHVKQGATAANIIDAFRNQIRMTKGSAPAALADGEYAVGDVDSLGFETVYVRDDAAAPNTSSNDVVAVHQYGVPIKTITTGRTTTIETLFSNNVQTNDKLYTNIVTASFLDLNDNGNWVALRFGNSIVLDICTENADAITQGTGYVGTQDLHIKGVGFVHAGRPGQPQALVSDYTGMILRRDAAFAQVNVFAHGGGGATDLQFKGLTVALRTPSSNQAQSGYGDDQQKRIGHFMPPVARPFVPIPKQGTVTPSTNVTPDYIGQQYVKTSGPQSVWVSTGLTDTDWIQTA
jgi:hypothetical protein